MRSHGMRRGAKAPPGQALFAGSSGTYVWVVPRGVTTVCVVCVGRGATGANGGPTSAGSGSRGGSLAYKNNISVVPGAEYNVVLGASNGLTYFGASSTVSATGGSMTPAIVGTGGYGGVGGAGGPAPGGGGGAGGYSGAGGTGGCYDTATSPTAGAGGAGGGGASNFSSHTGGGGVGVNGAGSNGTAGGGGGSSGSNGTSAAGGGYGGGGAGGLDSSPGDPGGDPAVRIIWGAGRSFPSTNTADV